MPDVNMFTKVDRKTGARVAGTIATGINYSAFLSPR